MRCQKTLTLLPRGILTRLRVLFVLHYALCILLLAHVSLNTARTRHRVTARQLDALVAMKLVVVVFGVAVTAAVLGISLRALADLPGLKNWAIAAYVLQLAFAVRTSPRSRLCVLTS